MTVATQPRGQASSVEPMATAGAATSSRSAVPIIVAAARRRRPNDPTFPLVVLAIAQGEGGLTLPTTAGDGGTSFGPFQLHEGGALPAGKDEAWANSPEGIDWAVGQIDDATKGLSGEAAIAAGVRRFERPAAPAPEVARDTAWYRTQGARGGPPGFVPPGTLPNPGGALGTGSGTLPKAKYTPGLFDCSGSDSYFFGLVTTPSSGAIGCYLLGALKLVGMVVVGSGLALAGFYLLLPRKQAAALRAAASVVPGVGGAAAKGAEKVAGGSSSASSTPPARPAPTEHQQLLERERANQARARTSKMRADARTARHRARQAADNTGATYKLSPATERALSRASSKPSRGRPDRMAG